MKEHNIEYWLQYIESFHPDEIELGLERIQIVASRLELFCYEHKVITVGGTNGKGSCVASIESLAILSGLKVGIYTSPHLLAFNERIRINANDVEDNELISAFKKIEQHRGEIALTFFEFTTLAALIIFNANKLDVIVLEVGLGGRLDAVNIINADVAIVTTVDRDHESWLGSDIQEIAFEKSGIFRKTSNNLVGDKKTISLIKNARPELGPVIQLVSELEPLRELFIDLDELISDRRINPNNLVLQNVQLAIASMAILYGDNYLLSVGTQIDRQSVCQKIERMLHNIILSGRFQCISIEPKIIVDVAHNEQAGKNLAVNIRSTKTTGQRIAICGMMSDKSIANFLKSLILDIDEWVFVDLPIERAISSSLLCQIYNDLSQQQQIGSKSSIAICSPNVSEAIEATLAKCRANDEIYIFGSFITVAAALQYCRENC